MKELIFKTDSNEINYFEGENNGMPPLLLLHGSASRWQDFEPIIPEFMRYSHVFAIDLRGHGKSGRTSGNYKIQDNLVDIDSFIKNCIKEPTIILGHSLGGMIAIMAAARHPELVRGIILGDPPLTIQSLRNLVDLQREFALCVIQWLRAKQVENIYEAVQDDFVAEGLSLCDSEMLSAMFNEFDLSFGEYNIEKLFSLINSPVLILRGNPALGSLISHADIDFALRLKPDLSHIQIPHAGHSIFGHDNSVVFNTIKSFIKNL